MAGRVSPTLLPVLACAVLAACGDNLLVRVRVTLVGQACGDAPEEISLPCEGRVGVWLVDERGAILDEACVPIDGYTPVTELDDILRDSGISFSGRPVGEVVSVELAVFAGPSDDTCARPDTQTTNSATFLHGRSAALALTADTEISLPLECVAIGEQCQPRLDVTVAVLALDSLDPISANGLTSVAVGGVRRAIYTPLAALDRVGDVWSGVVEEAVGPDCLAANPEPRPESFAVLSCDTRIDRDAGTADIAAHLFPQGALPLLDQFATDIQQTGLILGRVVSEDREVANLQISTAGGTGTVQYLDEQFTVEGDATGPSGYFLVFGPGSECCTTLFATSNSGADETVQSGPTGSVPRFVTTTVLRLP